jgi:cell division transport system permease protein
MKTALYNMGYFFTEAVRTIRFGLLSNIFSVLGTGLILFLLGMVLTGWSIGDRMLEAIGEEAVVSAYFTDADSEAKAQELLGEVKKLTGVLEVSYVDESQAKAQMENMLGEEADILSLFHDNPFEAFLEIRIDLEQMDQVITGVKKLPGIEYVRDNREILEKLKQLTGGLKLVGALIIIAVGVTTLIILSHMIRQGIYNNREQINTLRLLGAPNGFIGFPFLMAGTLLTLCGGVLADLLVVALLKGIYSQLDGVIPFLPLPSKGSLQTMVCLLIMGISFVLGILGSLFGLSSISEDKNK